ncbi:hypothetical protein FB645_006162 [Coemansia sp. IMI 203386]|nr:hypothetical protein FB645_006162 [Coemansia sp. IMI 203386]
MRLVSFSAFVLCMIAPSVLAHSWVDCVKYDPNTHQCLGYPRGYKGREDKDINGNASLEYTNLFSGSPASQPMCKSSQQTENYSTIYPMATAQPGETIYTSWQQNGHLNNASPTKVKILYYPSSSQTFSDVSEKDTAMVAGTMDYATDGNCYNPSEPNTVCFNSWTVPTDLVPGQTYHFVWFWYFNFNPAGEWYTTCFDVNVQDASHVAQGGSMDSLLKLGEPPLAYIQGIERNPGAKAEISDVTSLGLSNSNDTPIAHAADSSSLSPVDSSSTEVPTSSALATVPMPTEYSTSDAPVAPVVTDTPATSPVSSSSSVIAAYTSSSAAKCRPRPTSL